MTKQYWNTSNYLNYSSLNVTNFVLHHYHSVVKYPSPYQIVMLDVLTVWIYWLFSYAQYFTNLWFYRLFGAVPLASACEDAIMRPATRTICHLSWNMYNTLLTMSQHVLYRICHRSSSRKWSNGTTVNVKYFHY